MSKIVVKFGGSNLKKKEDFGRLLKVVKSYDQPLVIVISAFYGVTNILTSLLINIRNKEVQINDFINSFSDLQYEILEQNVKNVSIYEETKVEINKRILELKKYLFGIHYIGDIPDFVEDKILSYGEKFSSLILSAILNSEGIKSEELTPEEIGLLTDGEFGNATIDLTASESSVKKALAGEQVYVIPGFYGISAENKITLVGRGGTDYSAASIAYCINAPSLDIWKDVDGFKTADPKLVENTKIISKLNYDEAAELAYFGAKILHPRTVEPLEDKNIPIHIYNIEKECTNIKPLTTVSNDKIIHKSVVKSVTYCDDFSVLKLKGPGIGIKQGILAKVTKALNNKGINIKSVITSQITVNLLLSAKDIRKSNSIIKQLGLSTIQEIQSIEDISIIAVVGEGIVDNYGIAATMFTAVAKQNINVIIGTVGASQVSCYLIVNRKDNNKAIAEIHRNFFGN